MQQRNDALNKLASYKKPGALRTINERRFRHDVKQPVRPIEDKDVADPNTDTKKEDFSQDVEITVASLTVFGKSK